MILGIAKEFAEKPFLVSLHPLPEPGSPQRVTGDSLLVPRLVLFVQCLWMWHLKRMLDGKQVTFTSAHVNIKYAIICAADCIICIRNHTECALPP